MSIQKRVTYNEYGDPKVVITIEGNHDAFRFAWAMRHLQCEFSDCGARILGSLKRRLGAKRFNELELHFTGRKPLR